jgi:hypothetical protein
MRCRRLFAVCCLFFGSSLGLNNSAASASTYFYSMTGTLIDGASVSSNFSIDWQGPSATLNISSLTLTDPVASGTMSNLQTQTNLGSCSGPSCYFFHLNSTLALVLVGINLAFMPPDINGATSLLLDTVFSEILLNAGSGGGEFTSASVDVITTPLLGALPLFPTGLGTLGFLGWRRKRKQAASRLASV